MTDSSRFHSNRKTPFLFSPHDDASMEDLTLLAPSKPNSTTAPLQPLTSSSLKYQTQTHQHTSFQLFDPFNTDILENTTVKDADLIELSNLLSRQFLDDVDAETISTTTATSNNNIPPTTTSATIQNYSPPITSWRLEAADKIRKPWSPAFHSNGLLTPSSSSTQTTLLSQQDDDDSDGNNNNMSNTNVVNDTINDITYSPPPVVAAATWWDRYGPYGNDSEFDPTLPFYQGDTTTTTTESPETGIISSTSNSEKKVAVVGDHATNKQQQIDITMMALKKLSVLFPDLDAKELGQTLAALDYDVERTIETLLPPPCATTGITPSLSTLAATPVSTPPATATAEKVHLIKSPMPSMSPPPPSPAAAATAITGSPPKKRQVCRHYLAGECYRKDCWFAHDLEVKPCKFWLQGTCLKGDTCEFAHSLEEMDQVVKYHPLHHQVAHTNSSNHHPSQLDHRQQYQPYHHHQQEQQYTPTTVVDFPILVARSKRKLKKSHNKKSFKK